MASSTLNKARGSLRAFALTSAVLIAEPGLAQSLSGTQGTSLAAFTRVKRINGDLVYDPLAAFGPALYAQLRRRNIDLVRLPVRPLPLMSGTLEAQAHARSQVMTTVRQLAAKKITAIVDIHPWPPDTLDEEASLICTPKGAAALERLLMGLATSLSQLRGRVALELLNEPKRCQVNGQVHWPRLQKHLVARIRTVAPSLPLIVTPAAGQLNDLLAFDVTPYLADPNVLFSFHFYDPYVFTTPSYFNADPVPFPSPGNVHEGSVAFARADRVKMSAQHSGDLWRYLTRPNDACTISTRFAAITRWRKAAGLPARRIILGEYGVVRSIPIGSQADYTSISKWLAAVTRSARRNGIRPIFWIWPIKPEYLYDSRTRSLRQDAATAIGSSRR